MDRVLKYDIIKAFAAFLICIYHLESVNFGTFNENGIYIPNLTKFAYGICSAGVPLFFLICGVLLLNKKDVTWQYNIKKSINSIKVYLIWSILAGGIILIFSGLNFNKNNFIVAINYLWYFQSLAILYLFNILWCKVQKYRYSKYIPLVILIYPFCINFVYNIITYFNITQHPIHTGFFRLYSILYFLLPLYVTNHYSIKSIAIIIIGLLLIYFEVYVYSNFYGIIYDGVNSSFPTLGALCITIGIYQILSSIKYNCESIFIKGISFLGRNCLGIYIFHLPLIIIFRRIYKGDLNILTAIAVSITIVILSSISYNLIKKVPIINWTLKL